MSLLHDLVPDQFRTKTLEELLAYFRKEAETHATERLVSLWMEGDHEIEDGQVEFAVSRLRAHDVALAALAEALYRRPQITEFSAQERLPSDDTGFYVQLEEPGATVALLAPTLEQALSGALTYIKDHS